MKVGTYSSARTNITYETTSWHLNLRYAHTYQCFEEIRNEITLDGRPWFYLPPKPTAATTAAASMATTAAASMGGRVAAARTVG